MCSAWGEEPCQPWQTPQHLKTGRERARQTRRALTLGVSIAQGRGAHVTQSDGPFAAAVDKHIALVRVELGCGDHLCQLLHVRRFDVHDVCKAAVKAACCGLWPIQETRAGGEPT